MKTNGKYNLGIVDGQFASCPNKPNCVSSQAPATDKKHYIEALTYSGEPAQARERLERAIAGMKRVRVVERRANYWRAEFRSALWRFVDDVEFQFDDNTKRIDMRSAARVGYSDFGVNRRRIEEIRRRYEHLVSNVSFRQREHSSTALYSILPSNSSVDLV